MKKVTFFVLLAAVFLFGFTKRPAAQDYEKTDGFAPISRPLSGAEIFNSQEQYDSWQMARAAVNKDGAHFDFEKYSLLAVWLGKPFPGECIAVASVRINEKGVAVSAYPVRCGDKWDKPYIYYKVPKTDKKAVYVELAPSK